MNVIKKVYHSITPTHSYLRLWKARSVVIILQQRIHNSSSFMNSVLWLPSVLWRTGEERRTCITGKKRAKVDAGYQFPGRTGADYKSLVFWSSFWSIWVPGNGRGKIVFRARLYSPSEKSKTRDDLGFKFEACLSLYFLIDLGLSWISATTNPLSKVMGLGL